MILDGELMGEWGRLLKKIRVLRENRPIPVLFPINIIMGNMKSVISEGDLEGFQGLLNYKEKEDE